MGEIRLERVEKWFDDVQVIKGVDIDIAEGEFVVFVGPSGCGKSTLLRMIAGLEDTSRGTIWLDGKDVTPLPPSGRQLSMVFQSYALYPHMSVRENLGFGLKTSGVAKATIHEKVQQVAQVLELQEYLDRRPKALSGGQRQRVAIGRAIVREPKGFLFDEPLSNLDAALRVQMRFEIAKLHNTLGTTMIYVTHDQVEAMTLADRIVVLKDGLVMQTGSPADLYKRPDNLFVAQFIGSPKMNILPCKVSDNSYQLPRARFGEYHGPAAAIEHLGIRAEHISVVQNGEGQCDGEIEVIEYLGADTIVLIDCGRVGQVSVRLPGECDLRPGDVIGLAFDPAHTLFFDDTGSAVVNYTGTAVSN